MLNKLLIPAPDFCHVIFWSRECQSSISRDRIECYDHSRLFQTVQNCSKKDFPRIFKIINFLIQFDWIVKPKESQNQIIIGTKMAKRFLMMIIDHQWLALKMHWISKEACYCKKLLGKIGIVSKSQNMGLLLTTKYTNYLATKSLWYSKTLFW